MEEFEAGSKRVKRTETTEKTMYNSKEFSEKERDKLKIAPIGGKLKKTKKRDIKDGIKSANYKYKNAKEEDEQASEQIKELKRYYNQLRVKKGDLKPNKEQKEELINNCLQILGDEYKKFAFKHDSCRVMQSMLKHGNAEQRKTVIGKLLDIFGELITSKYSHHLAYRIVQYCTDEEQKKKIISLILNKIGVLIMHSYASDVVELLYINATISEKKLLVKGFYGKYFIILQENKGKSLRNILKEKPTLREEFCGKLEEL